MISRLNCSAVIIVSALLAALDAINIGDACTTEDGKNGTCVRIADCEEALKEIKTGKHPKTCYYNKLEPVVCCSEQQEVSRTSVGEIAARKCLEYLKPPRIDGCIDPDDERCFLAFNGVLTKPKEYVHMAALGYGEKDNILWLCGGSLISEKFVITAAHCLLSREYGPPKWVRLGDLNLANKTDDANAKTYDIKKSIRHPKHNPTTKRNDIALLELTDIVTMNENVKPACLPSNNNISGTLTATGWGVTDFLGQPSDHLLKVTLEPYDYSRCYQIFSKERVDNETQLCIGSTAALNQDTCPGDSGGPLQVNHPVYKKRHIIIGITSFGKACGLKNIPAIYTRVYAFIPWIESIVWPK